MTLKINREMFLMTFAADADYHTNLEGQQTYLDRTSGLLLYTVTDSWRVAIEMGEEAMEDYLESTSLVRADPESYLLVPSMSHAEHHSVMRDFVASEWCPDSGRRHHASESYYSRKSIGYWLKNVCDDGAVEGYFSFRAVRSVQLAESFLLKNGVKDFRWR
jgi:hypothetical protein